VHASAVPFEGMLWRAGVRDDEIKHYRAQVLQQARSRVNSLIESVAGGSHRIFRTVEHEEEAARLILAKEEALQADLIVMGKHGQSIVEAMLLGSVTRRILADSKGDVLIVYERPAATGT
jgi:nucleotide-binding universal stress UspA family protein